ncbi:lysophospholipid acyltransferase family protein [Schumannella soli]|uniref:lysophospholipid acyltransferase family protein n=1 Tax=Schumannella soli TaxID=2590779 RepID=UPI0021046945|nr:lysophospholipid acyltransferase family protein [Schumannella soli]
MSRSTNVDLPRRGVDWNRGWRAFGFVVLPLASRVLRLHIRGEQNLPQVGAFVVAANHYTTVDPIAVGLAVARMGRAPHFLLKASLLRLPVLGPILRRLGMIPVERAARGGGDPLAQAGALIARGGGVVIYPEGTLTRDPDLWPMRGKTGAVRAALGAGIPLVPVAHWGAQKVLPPYGGTLKIVPRQVVEILVGEPLDLSPWAGQPMTGRLADEVTTVLMNRIAELQGELRGETPPAERWDPAQHGQSEFGRP